MQFQNCRKSGSSKTKQIKTYIKSNKYININNSQFRVSWVGGAIRTLLYVLIPRRWWTMQWNIQQRVSNKSRSCHKKFWIILCFISPIVFCMIYNLITNFRSGWRLQKLYSSTRTTVNVESICCSRLWCNLKVNFREGRCGWMIVSVGDVLCS